MNNYNEKAIFRLCCIALTVTAMTFAIRAGILSQLASEYQLTDSQLGWVNSMAFLGFPVATLLGGAVYNRLGAKRLLSIAFVFHLLGLGLTINATGFWSLLISTFFIGFANGAVEAGCNPLITEIYRDKKTIMLNRFHVWFPAGIVLGALASKFMTDLDLGWQLQIALMLIPTVIYGAMLLKYTLPTFNSTSQTGLSSLRALSSPLFLFMVFCMTLTATTELGTQQWIDRILGESGASPMLIMALITGIMAVGRYFAGPLIKRLDPIGVLLLSAVIACIGIYSMSIATGNLVYLSAIIFALGVTYFWPTMLGFVAENQPQTGALGLSILSGAGMFAVSIYNPIIGTWIDEARHLAIDQQVKNPELVAGQTVLGELIVFPMLLIVSFTALFIYMRRQRHATSDTNISQTL
ncbi:MAG: MFS transporter [Colwellia sp.]|nr:MFS transporter [Colwellia sp.]